MSTSIESKLAAAVPLSVYQSLVRRPVIGLVYHAVSDNPPAYIKHIYPLKSPKEFEQDLIYLKENYSPISYDQLLGFSEGRRDLPANAVFVSFDDGYQECSTVAAPLLHKHGIPCTFFLTTGYLGNPGMYYRNKYSLCVEAIRHKKPAEIEALLTDAQTRFSHPFEDQASLLAWLRSLKITDASILDSMGKILGLDFQVLLGSEKPYLTTDQVEGLIGDGFSIGAHSVRHPKFLDLEEGEIQEEIVASCETISSLTGKLKIPFAFPFSGVGVERAWLRKLRQENPVIGLYFETLGIRQDASFIFNRIWADPPADPPRSTSNLAVLLHEAYQANAVWRRQYYASMAAYKLGIKRS